MTDLILFSLIGFGAGFVNAISGGGGLLAVSGFLALGIPPLHVLVYNRLVDIGTILGALKNFYTAQYVHWKTAFFYQYSASCWSYGRRTICASYS